jgi:hypothetical protein
MAHETLQAIVGTALVDSRFRGSLLGRQPEALRDFELTNEEFAAIAQSEATTFQGLAQDLHRWITCRTLASAAGGGS